LRTDVEDGAGGCRLAGLELTLRITVTLPEWKPGPWASDALRTQWAATSERLARHEDGHRQHAIDAAHELHQALARLPPQESCQRAQRAADDLLRTAVARLRLRDSIYDQRTDNGLAEPAPRHDGAGPVAPASE
jgi:predicted secreted Zn-dependent protease